MSSLEIILVSFAPVRQRYWMSLAAFGLGLSHLCVQHCCYCAMAPLPESAYCVLWCIVFWCSVLPHVSFLQSGKYKALS